MTIRQTVEIETIVYITLAALVMGSFILRSRNISPLVYNVAPAKAPVSPIAANIEISSQISPDGTKKLEMKITTNPNGTKTYEFRSSNSPTGGSVQIYSDINSKNTYVIPFNAWSPNNRYVFIIKNGTDAMVFNANGMPMNDKEEYIDLESVYKTRNYTNSIKEATGWADPNLIIFNTTDKNGQIASFWLEISSKAVIPLATRF